ncbi:MAG TPA: hypothetical protein VMQ81_01310 [Acidimicrobiia bacterium]|nr:hypothetical protein [Acidimicrobiia bacterium]
MKKLAVALVAALTLAVLAGCQPVKKRPVKPPVPTTTTQPAYPPA